MKYSCQFTQNDQETGPAHHGKRFLLFLAMDYNSLSSSQLNICVYSNVEYIFLSDKYLYLKHQTDYGTIIFMGDGNILEMLLLCKKHR